MFSCTGTMKAFGFLSFDHTDSTDPRGADIAREHFLRHLAAIRGVGMATAPSAKKQYPHIYQPGASIPVLPHFPNLDRRAGGAGGRQPHELHPPHREQR